jgi:prepilin-type N-terminal cleavage/methylation domain-containing protein
MNYIKTNNKWARQRGTTLIELSVVIAVILLLVGVLFIGVQAWRDGANRAASLVNISSLQKAVRGEENMSNPPLNAGAALPHAQLVTDGYFSILPTDPANSGGDYVYTDVIPIVGAAYASSTKVPLNAAQTANW